MFRPMNTKSPDERRRPGSIACFFLYDSRSNDRHDADMSRGADIVREIFFFFFLSRRRTDHVLTELMIRERERKKERETRKVLPYPYKSRAK